MCTTHLDKWSNGCKNILWDLFCFWFFASSGLKFAVKTLFRREYNPDNYVYFSYKALQHEGGDQENIQIQAPFDASSKKGGKTKGNVLVRKRDCQYIFFTIMFFQNYVCFFAFF